MAGNYNYTFVLAGGMIALSGLMLFTVPCIQRYTKQNAANKKSKAFSHGNHVVTQV